MIERDGLLIIDKPEGITSHDVIDHVRRALKMKRIGHTGTLDPIATGVLVLCLGKATRLQQFLMASDKEYLARIRLGFATDTYDRAGSPSSPVEASNTVMPERLQHVLEQWRGACQQIPPMFSAKKQAGQRLYTLARQGREVDRPPVSINIYALEMLPGCGDAIQRNDDGTSDFSIWVRCSAGTYIRSLAHEIGQHLGCGAHLLELRRTATGGFRIDQAITLDELERRAAAGDADACVIPLAQVPLDLPTITLSEPEADRLRHGQPVIRALASDGAFCKLVDGQGDLLAIGQVVMAQGMIQPRIVFC